MNFAQKHDVARNIFSGRL